MCFAHQNSQVRERQAAASLGLPSRIRDEDCDIEPLEYEDLVTKTPDPEGLPFGACKPEHINYVIKMVEMAKLCWCISKSLLWQSTS